MSLKFDGDYYAKATDAGPRVPPSFPSSKYRRNYDSIKWNSASNQKEEERKNKQ